MITEILCHRREDGAEFLFHLQPLRAAYAVSLRLEGDLELLDGALGSRIIIEGMDYALHRIEIHRDLMSFDFVYRLQIIVGLLRQRALRPIQAEHRDDDQRNQAHH